jgi:transposase-like protein
VQPSAPYPKTRAEFNAQFSSEDACLGYVMGLRWPEGYQCPCGERKVWRRKRGALKCSSCRRESSILAGTLLQGTRFPLRTWLEVAWQVCEQKNGVSALGLQHAVGFGSYHTAWEWLHRMRRVMVVSGRTQLNGEVEVDETFVGGVKTGKRGRGAAGKVLVLIAAEVRKSAVVRIRLQIIPDATASTLLDAVEELVEQGSNVVTDGLSSYAGLTGRGFNHTVSRYTPMVGKNLLPKVNRVASLLKRWLLGTHQGAVSHHLLNHYLNEYTFRFNRRASKSRGLLFYRLMSQAVSATPIPKARL